MNMDKIDQLRTEIIESETFCFYPFTQLSSNPAGHLKPCCNYVGTMTHPNGDIISILSGDNFSDAWNSEHLVDLRKKLHTGDTPDACRRCIRDGDVSMRTRSIEDYKNNRKTLEIVANSINNSYEVLHQPTYLELKPSNLCNLKCVMCNSYDSSQIAKELGELNNKFGGIKVLDGRFIEISSVFGITEHNKTWKDVEHPDWSDNEEIWESFTKLAPGLEVLSFAGGEPTIMPFVLKALQYVVDNDHAKNITVFLSSNFTNLNKNFLELMPKFKKFELIASIDGFDKVNDYARYPSKWRQVSKNYIEAKSYMKHSNVKILNNITVSSLNIVNLDSLLYFIEEQAKVHPYFKEWPYNINLIMFPMEQQISMLPQSLKDLATQRLTAYLENSQVIKDFPGLDGKIHLLLNELTKPDNPKLFKVFKHRIKILDDHRGISIGDYIPDLKDAFKHD
jgi:MoaA/NifB/PqqE/SkfB family radical SAM enzyme